MTNSRRRAIGILVPNLGSSFHVELVRGASDAIWASGRRALICETAGDGDRESGAFQLLSEVAAEGVLVSNPTLPDAQLVPWLSRFPGVVLVDRATQKGQAGLMRVDRDEGLLQAVRHLAARGCRRIGYLIEAWHCAADPPPGPEDVAGAVASAAALGSGAALGSAAALPYALTSALATAGLEAEAGICMACDPTWEGGYMTARDMLVDVPDVDGLICCSDVVAVGALHACASLGKRVPADIAIVGSDDALIARITRPSLTTLHVPKYQAGTMAAQMLLDRIDGEMTSDEIVISQRLVVRASAP